MKIDTKIENFNLSIKTLEGNKKIDSYYNAFKNYKDIRETILDMFRVLIVYLFEPILKSLIEAIMENMESEDSDGYTKTSKNLIPVNPDVYFRSFTMLSFNYLTIEKVNDIEAKIHDLYRIAEDYKMKLDNWEKVNFQENCILFACLFTFFFWIIIIPIINNV